MTTLSQNLEDPRRKNLAIMGAIALVVVVWAVWSVVHQAAETAPRTVRERFFPDLVSQAKQISHIRIQSKNGVTDVVFKPERGWVVASHDDYPASFDAIKQTVIGLASLTTIEEKTARPDWFRYVDLSAPDKGGTGSEITISDDKGHVLAALIAGKTVDIGDASGATGLFVRRPDEDQSWLARSVFEPKNSPSDWLDKQVMSIDRSRIAEADVDPLSGPSFVVRRLKPTDADFQLVDAPKGREVSYAGAPDGVGAALVDFSFDDVKPAKSFDFSDAAHSARIITKTFDGLSVAINVIQQDKVYWTTVSAEGANADAQKEARAINAHASGWAYKLPDYKGVQFTATLESMLKPKGNAAQAQAH